MQETPLRVLVADDDCVIASTLAQILRLSGYNAEAVNSGEQAVEAAAKRPPDVLVSDVVMGAMSGIEAASRILEMMPGCVVILISGQATTPDAICSAGYPDHSFEILAKPISPKLLLERIETLSAHVRASHY